MIISSPLLHSSNSNICFGNSSPEQFQAGNLGGCWSRSGMEVALALVLCDRLPIFTHVASTRVAGGSNAPAPQLLSMWFALSHHIQSLCGSALRCTAAVAKHSTAAHTLPLLLAPNSNPCPGFRTAQAEGESASMAEGLQLSRRDLAAAWPSPLACFALSGGHHTLFRVIAH